MGTVVLAGATSGSTTLTPVDAVTATITLPSVTATLATLGANTFTGNQSITGTLGVTGLLTGTLTNATGLPATTGITPGSANFKLFTNAAGTAPEWAAGIATISTTYDVTGTGTLVITGVGFKPKAVLMMSGIQSTFAWSIGITSGSGGLVSYSNGGVTPGEILLDGSFTSVTKISSGNQGLLALASFDSDGATFTKSKSGSPTGTVIVYCLFFR